MNEAKFINDIAYLAIKFSSCPVSTTIAQAILESNWGQSELAKNANNLFGIKWSSGDFYEKDTWEVVAGQNITVKAKFAKYKDHLECILAHSKFLQKDRYKNAFNFVKDPERFIEEIHKAGYATDPNYSDKIISIIKKYDLKKYDLGGSVSNVFKVALSAGHGAKNDSGVIDPGAVNKTSGLTEASVTKKIVDLLSKKLTENRISNSIVKRNWNLSTTVQEVNSYIGSDDGVFIEIHCNASTSSEAKGYETYYVAGSTKGKELAGIIQKNLIEFIQGFYAVESRKNIDRGIKTATFQVIGAMASAHLRLL